MGREVGPFLNALLRVLCIAAVVATGAMLLFDGAGFIDGWSDAIWWTLVFAAPGLGMVARAAWDWRRDRLRRIEADN
jgi:hypothetical protein